MKRYVTVLSAWIALCALACAARAVDLPGVYTYGLVLRDDFGFALKGSETYGLGDSVSENYTIEVFNAAGDRISTELYDWALGEDPDIGCNCTLDVAVGDGTGCAKVGERLTLVVTTTRGSERFRSSCVLPPVGGRMGSAKAPVGVFSGDASDTDNGWNVWLGKVESSLGASIGEPDDDYDSDGLANIREYQLGTDPAGGALGLPDSPGFAIEEQGDAYKVTFNYSWGHVYSVRMIEGTETVGVDGEDLELYEGLESLGSSTAWGTYLYDGNDSNDYSAGTTEFFVRKPAKNASHMIGLAVDGRLQEYITVASDAVTVTPGYPVEYESEAAASSAKAAAEVVPSEAVAAVLEGDGMADAYKANFTAEAVQKDGKWYLSAELTPEAWTNLMENATAATRQIPVAAIALLEPEATTNVVLTGCAPGFYYSLNAGAEPGNIAADSESANVGVLCGADGAVEFPKVGKPGESAGFYRVSVSVSAGE